MTLINERDLHDRTLRGADHGATISLILDRSEPGKGPRLHRHTYDETWIVLEGNVTFQVDGAEQQAGPDDIVIVPPGAPHKFTNNGPGRSRLICIHSSPTMITEWLE
jgi:mannose-6-phosphate isomerase-like protein (cupin superfamily)